MICLQQAKYHGNYRVWLEFSDGKAGVVDLADIPSRYLAALPLQDEKVFASFQLDEWPTLAWPSGFDLSPEFLYERLTGKIPAWANLATTAI
ncbi:MAG: DUF2442 domain-containing protein [Gallionella sp.]